MFENDEKLMLMTHKKDIKKTIKNLLMTIKKTSKKVCSDVFNSQ